MNGDSREPRHQDFIYSIVIENFVGRKDQAVFNRSHDFLGMFIIQRKDTVEDNNLAIKINMNPILHEERLTSSSRSGSSPSR